MSIRRSNKDVVQQLMKRDGRAPNILNKFEMLEQASPYEALINRYLDTHEKPIDVPNFVDYMRPYLVKFDHESKDPSYKKELALSTISAHLCQHLAPPDTKEYEFLEFMPMAIYLTLNITYGEYLSAYTTPTKSRLKPVLLKNIDDHPVEDFYIYLSKLIGI